MKYLLILSFLFLISCNAKNITELSNKHNSIKYKDKFTVEDDFYGFGSCTADAKYESLFRVCGICKFAEITKELCYNTKDIKLEKE